MTTAYCLARSGYQSTVYEAAPVIGGLSRSFELWGQIVDLGPHRFFSNDKRINELWTEVLGEDYALVDRLTRIYYNSELSDLKNAHLHITYYQNSHKKINQKLFSLDLGNTKINKNSLQNLNNLHRTGFSSSFIFLYFVSSN